MIRVIAEFSLKDGAYDKAVALAEPLIKLTREEADCALYTLARSAELPYKLVMLEAWESHEALTRHSNSDHYNKYVPELAALCTKAPVVELYNEVI